jgi:hypothetical protein
MLLSTRNFLLYLLAVGFLVVAITTTAVTKNTNHEASVIMGVATDVEPTYEAEAVETPTLDRGEKLRSLRSKIAALGDVFSSTPETTVVEPVSGPEADPEENEPIVCANERVFTGAWAPGPVTFSVVEGARLVTRAVTVSTTTASGTPIATTETKVLAQLPLRSAPHDAPSCPPTDVVGIASDGSLIRNSEVGLYSVFGSETLVGYALDGFPIYGTSAGTALDACGGTSELGQYRYFLDKERSQVLSCFSAQPVEL